MTELSPLRALRPRHHRPLLRRSLALLAALALIASLASCAFYGVRSAVLAVGSASGHSPASVRTIRRRLHYATRRNDDGTGDDGLPESGEGSAAPDASDGSGDGEGCDGSLLRRTPPRPYYVTLPLLAFGCLYMFLALAIACDDCFVPALEYLSSHFGLSDDVAGATLMAAGGSAPELFTALVGTFQREAAEGIAVSTVLGSAVFNVLFVIGACSLAVPASSDVRLHPYPLLRDCTCYVIGLTALATFAGVTSPGVVEPLEAAAMFGLYCSYVAFMAYGNGRAQVWFEASFGGKRRVHAVALSEEEDSPSDKEIVQGKKATDLIRNAKAAMGKQKYFELPNLHASEQSLRLQNEDNEAGKEGSDNSRTAGTLDLSEVEEFDNEDWAGIKGQIGFDDPEQPAGEASREVLDEGDGSIGDDDEDEDEDGGPLLDRLSCPASGSSFFSYISYVVQLPLVVLLGLTIPHIPGQDDNDEEEKAPGNIVENGGGMKTERPSDRCATCRAYVAFLLSICWIGTFTYAMVLCAELIGAALGVPNAVMGLTVLATGASVPDMLSAVNVARKGRGDMAVSCTVGSNIFDLLLGLPVPWLLSFAIPGYPEFVRVGTDDMVVSIAVLVGMLAATIVAMKCLRWKMGRGLGLAMFGMYMAFLAQAVLRELPFDNCS